MQRIRVFTDRYPFLGPLIYILSVQYYVAQLLVAATWSIVPYSFSRNVISDLGNTACGQYGTRVVCSPGHTLMNFSFVALGVTMAVGSLLIYHEFERTKATLAGFGLMGLAGLGTILVGAFPENVSHLMHGIGAFLAFVAGNLSLVVLAYAINQARDGFRLYTAVSGIVSLVAVALFATGHYVGLGSGGIERVISYPQTFWLILFGLYMSATRWRANRPSLGKQ